MTAPRVKRSTRHLYIASAALVGIAVVAACSSDGTDALPDQTYFSGADSGSGGTNGNRPSDAGSGTGTGTGTGGGAGDDTSGDDGSASSGDGGGSTTVDAGRDYGTDASTFLGASRCSSANVLLCDGFEGSALDTSTWSIDPTGGTAPTIVTTQAARGASSVHFVLSGAGGVRIRESKTFPVASNRYFGRVFARFHSLPIAPMTYAHWTFAAGTGTNIPTDIRLSAQFQSQSANGKNIFGVGTDETGIDGGTGDWTQSDNDPTGNPLAVPLDKWLCIEWMNDGAANETRFWWDGVEHTSMHTTATTNGGNGKPYILPTFTSQWIGFEEYQPSTEPFEAWMDEFAIDSTRIGCVL